MSNAHGGAVAQGEAITSTELQDRAVTRRRGPRFWVGIGVAAAVLLAGIPTGVWLVDHIVISQSARADAHTLSVAKEGAQGASAAFDEIVELAVLHTETTAIPVRDAVSKHSDDFGEEQAETVKKAVESLIAAMESPLAREPLNDAEDDGALSDAAAEAVDPWALSLRYLSTGSNDVAGDLEAHYRTLSGEQREQSRAEVAAESDRFDALAASFMAAKIELQEAVDAVDASILAVIITVEELGPKTIESLEHGSEESLAALQGAIDALAELAVTKLPIAWEQRTTAHPAAFENVADSVAGYVAAGNEARKSHKANTPKSSGNRQGYSCFRWSPYGSYLAWCY